MEFVKHALHHGRAPALHYYRDSAGLEVDQVVEDGMPAGHMGLVEVKAGQTFHNGTPHGRPHRAARIGEGEIQEVVLCLRPGWLHRTVTIA